MKLPTRTIRIAIADEQILVREGLKALLNVQAGLMVVAEIDDAAELTAELASTPCDVLLLAGTLLGDGRADLRELRETTSVLLMCEDIGDGDDAVNALRAGARGVVFKRGTVAAFIQAIRTVAGGQVWMPPDLQARVADTLHEVPRPQLTPREREIVRQISLGLRNSEIAATLFISVQTVKTHLSHIFRKLGVRDRAALILCASRLGLGGTSAPSS